MILLQWILVELITNTFVGRVTERCEREVVSSSFELDAGFTDWNFRGFPESLQATSEKVLKISPQPLPYTSF
jgi:hypothetical protein